MSQKRLKIAYVSEFDPRMIWPNSGGNYRIYNAIQEYVGDVTVIENHWGVLNFLNKLIRKMPVPIQIRLHFRMHLLLSKFIARKTVKNIKRGDFDVVFCPYSFFSLADVKKLCPLKLVFTSDATYTAYKNSEIGAVFGSFFSLSRLLDGYILKREKQVYNEIDLNLWPSQWLKEEADKLYSLNDSQSLVVPWGANVSAPSVDDLNLKPALDGQINLLLVGRDWWNKGGPLAHATMLELRQQGINASLTVVGCVPPESFKHENMINYPQLDKTNPEDYQTLISLYRNSHFFVMPSFESYGFAFCEASAYALPSLCLKIGGVPVVNGVNGYALPKDATAVDFARKIISHINDQNSYHELRASTRKYYEGNLNWEAWGKKVKALIKELVGNKN